MHRLCNAVATRLKAPRIGAVMASDSAAAQALLTQVATRWKTRLTIVGLTEEPPAGADPCAPGTLISIGDGKRFPIAQDLGCGAQGCTLDSAALMAAGQWVESRITTGCDLVILNKFGKLEAETGSGLMGALTAAVALDLPVLLAVPPRFGAQWESFADGLATRLPPQLAAIETWLAQIFGHRAADARQFRLSAPPVQR